MMIPKVLVCVRDTIRLACCSQCVGNRMRIKGGFYERKDWTMDELDTI